jgi:putative cell wall-binding protein
MHVVYVFTGFVAFYIATHAGVREALLGCIQANREITEVQRRQRAEADARYHEQQERSARLDHCMEDLAAQNLVGMRSTFQGSTTIMAQVNDLLRRADARNSIPQVPYSS